MSAEFWAIIGVGATLLAALYQFTGGLRGEVAIVRGDVGQLRERMAKLEGAMDGFTKGFSVEN